MKYVKGDLFDHVSDAPEGVVTIIPHIVNNVGAWGAGFVLPLAKKYPKARAAYFMVDEWKLGSIQLVATDDSEMVFVANMVGQEGIGKKDGVPPIRYEELKKCMYAVRDAAKAIQIAGKEVRIMCPMFGAGLAGGDWNTIALMIFLLWSEEGIDTTVFFLPGNLPEGINENELLRTEPDDNNGRT